MKMQRRSKAEQPSPVSTIIAALCIVIYLVALVQAAIRMYFSIDQRRITADMEFSNIKNSALSAGMQGFMDDRFIETVNNALASSKSIEALIISGPDGEYPFERQKGRAITFVNNSPRFINRFSFSNHVYTDFLPIHDLRNANIRAVASAFDFAEFSKILRETLFFILAGFALAFFTMLIQLLLGKSEEKVPAPVYANDDYEPVREVNYRETIIKEEEAESVPKGLYSPRSNIGWEEYTKDRLDSELHRCASTEKDLTLIALEFTEEMNNSQFRQAAEEAVSSFTTRDLLFETGRQGITVIFPGIDLETGLEKARKFLQRIKEKIFFNHRADRCLYIGLSSRSGRLLNAERMLMEANEALQKAKTDPDTSIIAFKSDPEKYRKFIASQNPRHS
jgi:GGDEF domain-containing protein